MKKIIAIANQKGGVAKTTTTGALAAGLKQKGYKVLTIDLDPQGNLTDSVGADGYNFPTTYELMKREAKPEEAIQHLEAFDIIPANIMLAGAEQEFSQIGKEQRLKETIAPVVSQYDYIIIDTPPALGVLTVNAFTVADEIIIPTTAGIFAAKGIRQLHDTIVNVQKYCNDKVKIAGILLTKYNPRSNNNKDMKELTEQIGEYIKAPIFKTYIRATVAVEEAQARATDLFTYNGDSTAAADYAAFVDEYLKGDNQ
jgi:chromosome partitioning protein